MEQTIAVRGRLHDWAALAVVIAVGGCSSATTSGGTAGMGSLGQAGASGSTDGSSPGGFVGSATAASGSGGRPYSGGDRSGSGGTEAGGNGARAGSGGWNNSGGAGPASTCLSHDINIPATTISGSITINGVAITEGSTGIVGLALVNAAGDSADLFRISASSYSALVAPGTYDLYYSGDAGTAKLQSGIVVGASPLSLNVDIPTTTVSTIVTLNGAALPKSDTSSNGFLELRKGTEAKARLADAMGGSQTNLIVPGTYDLYYSVYGRSAEALPANTSTKLQSGLVIGKSPMSLKIDVPVTTVSTTLTVAGATLANFNSGATIFTLENDSGDSVELMRTSSLTGASSGSVIPGTYDLYYRPDINTDTEYISPGLPKNRSAKLMSGIVVGSSALSLKVDVPATTVSGKVSVNGAAVSGLTGSGILTLSNPAGDKVELSPDTTGSYSLLVIPGTYDLTYDAPRGAVASAPKSYSTKIKSGVVVGSSPLTLDIDIPAVTVSGTITLNGARLTGSTSVDGEGSLILRDAAGGQSVLCGLHTGSYSTLVIPGTYDLVYNVSGNGSGVLAVPINQLTVLQKGIAVGASPLSLDIDVHAVTVTGTVTVNGSAIPEPMNAGLGLLTLEGLNGTVGVFAFTSSATSDPSEVAKGAYSALVIPGAYELYFRAYRNGPAIPGNHHLDLGCFDVP